MVEVVYTKKFRREFKKLNSTVKKKAIAQIKKVLKNPKSGKPLRYNLTGERTIYIKPYRMIYAFVKNKLYLLRIQHREEVY